MAGWKMDPLKMYLLLKMVVFQLAMLVYQRVINWVGSTTNEFFLASWHLFCITDHPKVSPEQWAMKCHRHAYEEAGPWGSCLLWIFFHQKKNRWKLMDGNQKFIQPIEIRKIIFQLPKPSFLGFKMWIFHHFPGCTVPADGALNFILRNDLGTSWPDRAQHAGPVSGEERWWNIWNLETLVSVKTQEIDAHGQMARERETHVSLCQLHNWHFRQICESYIYI